MSIDSQSSDTADIASQPLTLTVPTPSKVFTCLLQVRRILLFAALGSANSMAIVIASKQQKSLIPHLQRCPRISTQLRVRKTIFSFSKERKIRCSVLSPTLEEDRILVGTSFGNCVVSYSVLQEILGMTVCKECLVGQMRIFDTQTRCGCAFNFS